MRSALALAVVALSCGAASPVLAAQTWQVEGGTLTVSLDPGTLRNWGFEVVSSRTTAAPGVETSAMLEPPTYSFAIRPSAGGAFVTEGGRVQEFAAGTSFAIDGGLAFRTFVAGTGDALRPVFLYDFEAVPVGDFSEQALELRTAGDVDVPFVVERAGFRFDPATGRLVARMGDVECSPELARALGQEHLAGQWIGVFDLELNAVTRDPADEIVLEGPTARGGTGGGGSGIDVRLGQLYGITSQGRAGTYPTGRSGLSASTTSCNAGTETVPWNAAMAETHPFIALAMFRLENGVLEQLGKNWLKHGWYALSSDQCNLGCTPSDGTYLGIGCSDTYSSGNNGNRWDLGPRQEVDPWAGTWVACGSYFDEPGAPDADCDRDYFGSAPDGAAHRLEVWDEDLGHTGAQYYYEGQYIVANESYSWDNIGWRRCTTTWTGGDWSVSDATGGLVPTYGPLVLTWGDESHTVPVATGDGNVVLAVDVTDLGGGQWHYEYALYNWRSNRGVRSISIPVGTANVTNVGFHDIDKTAGNDWQVTQAGGQITWATDDYATDPDANALHYQTMFNFRFDADVPPTAGMVQCGIFEPGTGTDFFVDTQVPDATTTDVVVVGDASAKTVLHAAEPNPFSAGTRIAFSLPREESARLTVVDVSGREVRVLLDGAAPAGRSTLDWDGRDASGTRVASGVYFFRLQTDTEVRTKKATLLR
ncbi:MAG: FlgD immunoglobulin-like domain containing protein [bacterium]